MNIYQRRFRRWLLRRVMYPLFALSVGLLALALVYAATRGSA